MQTCAIRPGAEGTRQRAAPFPGLSGTAGAPRAARGGGEGRGAELRGGGLLGLGVRDRKRSYHKHANQIRSNTLPVRQLPFEAVDQGGNKAPV